ncbi:MAG: cell wall hydrolase [Clostridia bacterium]|nr:cell wall hydrolase [Clostridia bacterium]
MRKAVLFAVVLAALVYLLMPAASYTEDRATVRLAQTIYALGHDEAYDTKLAIGSVVMNRVDSAWFADSMETVLEQQQQFPAGSRYDEDSLRAAHAVLTGTRTLDGSALYYCSTELSGAWTGLTPVKVVGGYAFYAENGWI